MEHPKPQRRRRKLIPTDEVVKWATIISAAASVAVLITRLV